MELSIHQAYQIQRRLSSSFNQSKLVKSAIKSRKSSGSSSNGDGAKRNARRKVSIVLPTNNESAASGRRKELRLPQELNDQIVMTEQGLYVD